MDERLPLFPEKSPDAAFCGGLAFIGSIIFRLNPMDLQESLPYFRRLWQVKRKVTGSEGLAQ